METTVPTTLALRQRTRFIGLFAGVIAGVLNAVVARALMRVIALLMFGAGTFTLGGTAVIFLFGALVGPLFGLIYRNTFYKLRAPELVKGLLFGLVLVVFLQIPGLYAAPEFAAELMAVGPLGFAVFGAMNFAFVLTLAVVTAWLEKIWSFDDSRQRIEITLTIIFGFMAVLGLALLSVEFGGRLLGVVK